MSLVRSIIFRAVCKMVKFLRPRKSILRSPKASKGLAESCVIIPFSSLGGCCKAVYFARGSSAITTAQACTDTCRTAPSSFKAFSITCLKISDFSIASLSSGDFSSASFNFVPGRSGISFANSFISTKGTPSTRPTSFTAARAANVPKVHICATRSRPYFSTI